MLVEIERKLGPFHALGVELQNFPLVVSYPIPSPVQDLGPQEDTLPTMEARRSWKTLLPEQRKGNFDPTIRLKIGREILFYFIFLTNK